MTFYIRKTKTNRPCRAAKDGLVFLPTGEKASRFDVAYAFGNPEYRDIRTQRPSKAEKSGFSVYFRDFSVKDGRLKLGCCVFTKKVTRRLWRWAGQ